MQSIVITENKIEAVLVQCSQKIDRNYHALSTKSTFKLSDAQLTMPFIVSKQIEPQPFLKWAGGKTSLLNQLEKFFPLDIDRYIEPFLGGGAVFFFLKHRFPALRAFLCDGNEELINSYRIVRDYPEELMGLLDTHAYKFRAKGSEYFYAIREQHRLADNLARAARTIFLNKTCFNGLFRVNAKGEFNTPVGSNKTTNLYSRENILAASMALQSVNIETQDFRKTADKAQRGDFIYFDPPYLPISIYSDFKRYTSIQFRESDQVELMHLVRKLDSTGCRFVISNSEHPRIRELYTGFSIHVVSAPRYINSKPNGRGKISEIVIANTGALSKSPVSFTPLSKPTFPETKYMGSKQRLLPFIREHLSKLKFNSALDAFSGSGCVGYAIKQMGTRVYSNDFLNFCFHIGRATIENNTTKLTEDDLCKLLRPNVSAPTFVRDTYKDLFFNETDCIFLDNLWANIQELKSPLKISLALAAASRACMKKRPRGMFTSTGSKGWDNRIDLKLSMREQFLNAVDVFNGAVFSNGQRNKAFNTDVFDLESDLADLVYIDTPYISPFSDCDYTRRYHFVEGYCRYWKDVEITNTTTKKIRSFNTDFSTKAGAHKAFEKLFYHFRKSKLVVSYSSNSIPSKDDMIELLKCVKKEVTVYESAHRYHHGNHSHKVGDNKNTVVEYLFIAE